MSAKKTADAALAVAEEALNKVYSLQSSSPILLVVVIFVLGYLYYINYVVVKDSQKSYAVLDMYHNANLRMGVATLIVLGMSGVFGHKFVHFSTILAFAYVFSYTTVKNLRENMENQDAKQPSLVTLQKKLSDVTSELKKKKDRNNGNDQPQPMPDDMSAGIEGMENYPKCTPCNRGNREFNPQPYEPDARLMGIGNDKLPPMGNDFLSAPPGVYSQSQIAYEMGMS